MKLKKPESLKKGYIFSCHFFPFFTAVCLAIEISVAKPQGRLSGNGQRDKSSPISLSYHQGKLKSPLVCTNSDLKGQLHASNNLLKVTFLV